VLEAFGECNIHHTLPFGSAQARQTGIAGQGYFSVYKERNMYLVGYTMSLPRELVAVNKNKSPYGPVRILGRTDQFDQVIAMADAAVRNIVPDSIYPQ
jgi:hypothetical protein